MNNRASTRLFFALLPDPVIREDIVELIKPLSGHKFQWIHPHDLHATLVFIGDVSTDRLATIMQVGDAIQQASFTVELDHINYWHKAKILWCGPREMPAALVGLADELKLNLTASGFQLERRPYRMHVTLARKAQCLSTATIDSPLIWSVREFSLLASQPNGQAPFYQELKRWPLIIPSIEHMDS